jgi:exodeoxyribonuclease III
VAILSRVGLDDVAVDFTMAVEPDSDARIVWATCGRGAGCQRLRPQRAGPRRRTTSTSCRGWPACEPTSTVVFAGRWPVAVLGDFNIAPEDRDVWDIAVRGVDPCDAARAGRVRRVLAWGLVDVFREQYPDDDGLFTYWDYTAGRFHKRQGMRIDFVLASTPLADTTEWALVDRNARKGDKPSDHAPLMVQFAR